MPLNFNSYLIIGLCIVGILQTGYIYKLKADRAELETQIAGYNAVIENTNAEQLGKMELAKEQIKQIEYRTKEKIKTVKEYVYDNNKSECDNAIQSLRLTF